MASTLLKHLRMTGLTRAIEDAARDLRHAARMLRRTRGFTLTVLAVLAVGIGANAAVFSVVNSLLLRPLPYPDADRIVQLIVTSRQFSHSMSTSIPKFNAWRFETHAFESIAAYQAMDPGVSLTGGDAPEHLPAMHVSADYFRVFGARLIHGRTFSDAEDRPRGPHVAILSHGLWIRRFGGDTSVVGRMIPLGGQSYEVIGVLERDFKSDPAVDLYLPLQPDPFSLDFANVVRVVARLAPTTTLWGAQRALSLTLRDFQRKYPLAVGPWENFSAIPLREALVGDMKPVLQMLTAAVAFVLVIGCANVANLLLARGHRRRREIATRAALGAGRWRVVRHLLAESGLLAIAGGVLGLATGWVALSIIEWLGRDTMPRLSPAAAGIELDSAVVVFTVSLSLGTGLLFGLLPALSSSRVNLSAAFKDAGSATEPGWRRQRTQAVLVTLEMTLALVLLVGAGLMIKTVTALRQVDRGFDPSRVLTLETSLSGTSFDTTDRVNQAVRNARQQLEGVGGVATFAASRALPLEPSFSLPFTIARRPVNAPFEGTVNWRSVTPGYFDVFRLTILRGRAFTDRDEIDGPPVVIVNQALARKYWQRNDPVGERITIGTGAGIEFRDVPRQIVGVVADARDAEANRNPAPMVYVPLAQVSDAMTARNNRLFPLTWVLRTEIDPRALGAVALREVRAATGGLPVARMRTMEEILAGPAKRAGFTMALLTGFAGIALLLAVTGLYGLMSYSVQQRTQEIGIRMALGAVPSDVRNLVLIDGLRVALAGVALGVGTALVLTRLMSSLVFGIRTYDPMVFAAVVILLTGVALAAAIVPAHRATRVSPLDAVRGV